MASNRQCKTCFYYGRSIRADNTLSDERACHVHLRQVGDSPQPTKETDSCGRFVNAAAALAYIAALKAARQLVPDPSIDMTLN